MLPPPPVIRPRGSVHRSLDKPVEWRPLGAGSITPPPMSLVKLNLVMECVINTDAGACGCVDPVHVFVELRPMPVVVVIVVRHEEEGVDHLVEQRLHQVLPGPQLEQGDGDAYGAESLSREVSADASTLVHPGGPLDLAHEQLAPEEGLIELEEQGVEVGGGVDGLPLLGHTAHRLVVSPLARGPVLRGQEGGHLIIGGLALKLLLQPPGEVEAGGLVTVGSVESIPRRPGIITALTVKLGLQSPGQLYIRLHIS